MIVAKIKVDGVCAVAEYRKLIPAGIIGAQVQFDYAADPWDGLHKTVVFRGAVTKDVITDVEVVTIPAEVVAKPNVALRVGVYGVDADGNIAIPTLWADLGNVRDAADPSGDTTTDPSLPVWAKLQAMIGDLDALDTVAKNNLVAAINEAMTKGGGSVDEAEIQRIVEEYLAANPPKVTETDPTVPPWAKQPQKPTYTADEVHALPDTYTPPNQTAQQVGADPAGTAATAVSQHNTDTTAHNDLRVALQELANRVNAALDSDDTTLDQMSEVVAYIKSNKSLIDAITTSKVSVGDIVNDLVTNVADKPLSAAQGVAINGLIDELRTLIPEAYTLPVATETTLGGVKPVTATDAMTQSVGVTTDGRLVTKPGDGGSGIAVTGATVGQTVKIAAVDDNGVPTSWEPVDFPSGGEAGSAHCWETIAIVHGTNSFLTPTAYDRETGYFTVPNHGVNSGAVCAFCVSDDTPSEAYMAFGVNLKSLGTFTTNQIVVVDDNTFYIRLNFSTTLVGDLGIDIEYVRIFLKKDPSIKFTSIGDPIALRLTVVGIIAANNPYLTNDTLKRNVNQFNAINSLWPFASGLYGGSIPGDGNSALSNAKITWEIFKISDRRISVTGRAVYNYHNGSNGINKVTDFSGVFVTPADRYDFSEITYVNIYPSVNTTFFLEALYKES